MGTSLNYVTEKSLPSVPKFLSGWFSNIDEMVIGLSIKYRRIYCKKGKKMYWDQSQQFLDAEGQLIFGGEFVWKNRLWIGGFPMENESQIS